MGSAANGGERGNEGFQREALDPVEAWNARVGFQAVVDWQVSAVTARLIEARLGDGILAYDAAEAKGLLLTLFLRDLWLPIRMPRGWRR